ncbi:phage holin family protein [Lentzea sp. NBRC 105346]|uniref:phage holin family protein n=1 Tax=Lentzea sp. NBRC 105346 TaxID=3032205 RepID=UPI0025542075|nr:phage holin family protein [Lentzea sp. NBRC 105346]
MDNEPSTAQLVSRLSEQVSHLVRDEMRLASAELRDKGKHAGVGAGLFGGAGVFAWWGGLSVVAGLILLLAQVLEPWAAAFIIAAALLVIAGILALIGRAQIKRGVPPVPEQAMASVKQDIATIREGAHR